MNVNDADIAWAILKDAGYERTQDAEDVRDSHYGISLQCKMFVHVYMYIYRCTRILYVFLSL